MWDYLNSVKHRAGLFKQQNIWRYYICHHWMILYDVWLILYSYTIEYIGYDHHPWGELCSNLQQFLMGWDDGFCGFEHSNGLNMGYDVQYLYMYIYIYMYVYTIIYHPSGKQKTHKDLLRRQWKLALSCATGLLMNILIWLEASENREMIQFFELMTGYSAAMWASKHHPCCFFLATRTDTLW